MNQKQTPNYTFALIVVFIVCFLIGFITTMNNSMIDFCTKAFNLNAQQGQYVNTAFYGAYIFAIPFSLLMSKIGGEVVRMAEYMARECQSYVNGAPCKYEVTAKMLETMA